MLSLTCHAARLKEKKRVACLEPNMLLTKNTIVPMVIMELAYR